MDLRIGCANGHMSKHRGCVHCEKREVRPACAPTPPDECPVTDCPTTMQRNAQGLYFVALLALILFIVVSSLAALKVLRADVSPLDIVNDVEIYLRPHDWFWAGFVLFWGWLAVGIAVGWKTAKRSEAIEFVFRGIWQYASAVLLWTAAILAWIFEESHILALVFLLVALILFSMSMSSLYISSGKAIPTFNVYLFWIASHAFAVGWTLVTAAFVSEAVFQRCCHDSGVNGKTVAIWIYVFAILLPGLVFGWLMISKAFVLPLVLYTAALPALSGTGHLYTNSANDSRFKVVTIFGVIVLAGMFAWTLWLRILSRNPRDGLALFQRKRPQRNW